MLAGLLDRIYECSFAPDNWPDVLSDISDSVEAVGANLSIAVRPNGHPFSMNLNEGYYSASSHDVRGMIEAMSDPRLGAAAFFERLAGTSQFSFEGDHAIFSAQDYENEPVLRDVLIPRGVKWGAGTFFSPPVGATMVVGMRRATERGPFGAKELELLNTLRPHIGRATLVAARMQMERARAAAQALAALGLPALVCDGAAAVAAVNGLMEAQTALVQWLARDKFAFRDRVAQEQLEIALAASEAAQAVRSFPLRDSEGLVAMVAHVVPIRRSARDIFSRSAAAVILTPVAAAQSPSADLVRSLFDLTSGEASVAVGLAQGKTVDDLASEGGVSVNTIRTQVRRVLEKTGSRRQTDAALLLAGLNPVRGFSTDP